MAVIATSKQNIVGGMVVGLSIAIVIALVAYQFATGSSLAFPLLFDVLGGAIGIVATYFATRRVLRSGMALFLIVIISFVAVVVFPALLGGLPTISGSFAQGFLYGIFIVAFLRLVLPATREEARQRRRWALQGWTIVVGAVVFLFALAFVVSILLEYAVGPLVRFFA